MTMPALSSADVKAALKEEARTVESWLASCLRGGNVPQGLLASMEYSLLAGGKRIRPVLCLLAARLCGLESSAALPFAGALECIHTYSLIHDDLPAMDDDALRRGKPSNHKQFDEATAILAGDGLLTDAFALMASVAESRPGGPNPVPADRVLRAVAFAAQAAGSPGMVGGQFLDMQFVERNDVSLEELAAMHAMKTGALLKAACVCGALLAGADGKQLESLSRYGADIGSAFQIADDILDETGTEEELGKPVGSDAAMNKCTYPSLLGLEESRKLAEAKAASATAALDGFSGPAAALLRGLAAYIVNRVS